MPKIIFKEQLTPLTWRYRIDAPRIAKHRKAGQFIILRPTENSERIPLTMVGGNIQSGWIEIIFQVVGKTTSILSDLNVGNNISDLAGPLGEPTHIENFGHCVCIGGGVGTAPLLPIIQALHEKGNQITTILGARNSDLLILENETKEFSHRHLIATDDGSKGHKGFAADILKQLIQSNEKIDLAVVIGPVMMMRATSSIAVAQGISTVVSLNPIMIDGTGMCGGCRVSIGNKTKFACVDGPEFDASLVNWDSLLVRLTSYRETEKKQFESHKCKLEHRES